jgi:hypothetical protein
MKKLSILLSQEKMGGKAVQESRKIMIETICKYLA